MKYTSLKRNALLNMMKQTCSVVFPIVTFPYVSRTLGASAYGQYSFSNSIANYFILLAALGISTYAVREGAKIRNNRELINDFVSEIFTINVISSILSLFLMVLSVFLFTKLRDYRLLICIQGLQIVLATIGIDWVNTIYEDYIYLTLRYIVFQVIGVFLIFLFVKSPADVFKYTLILVFVSGGGNILNVFYVKRYVRVKLSQLNSGLIRHIKPIFILFADSVAVTLYVNSDITMLGIWYSDDVVGIYSLASKLYNVIKMALNAVVVVATPRVAAVSAQNLEENKNLLSKIFSAVMCIAFPASMGLMCIGKSVISLVGGTTYASGGLALSILAVSIVFAIMGAFFTSCVLIVCNQESKCLLATSVSAIINVSLNVILGPRYGIIGAAFTTVLSETLSCFMKLYFAKRNIDGNFFNDKDLKAVLVGSGLVVLSCIALDNIKSMVLIKIIVQIVISMIVYAATLIVMQFSLIPDRKRR